MSLATKIVGTVALMMVALCSGVFTFAFRSDRLYQQEREELLTVAQKTIGMSRPRALEFLRGTRYARSCTIESTESGIMIISKNEYTFFADGVGQAACFALVEGGRVTRAEITFVGHD